MPSVETKIFQAIKARVATLPMAGSYPVKWTTDESYQPNPSQPYLRATWLPNINRRLFLNGSDPHQRLGVLQIDVMGKKTSGDDVAIEVAGQVAAHFPADQAMTFQGVTARVERAPDVRPVIIDKHIQVTISIRIETFA